MNKILICVSCKIYTLDQLCPNCRKQCINPKPAKFSPEDKFGYWRRRYKQDHELEL